jgi:hypothetical protein
LAVQLPRPPLFARQVGNNCASLDFEAVTHARQQPTELVVTEVDLGDMGWVEFDVGCAGLNAELLSDAIVVESR